MKPTPTPTQIKTEIKMTKDKINSYEHYSKNALGEEVRKLCKEKLEKEKKRLQLLEQML